MKDEGSIVPETQRPQFFSLTRKKINLLASLLVASCGVMIFNMLYTGSAVIGFSSTMIFFASIGIVGGKVLYDDDPLILKIVKAWFTVAVVLTVVGTFALYFNYFTKLASALIIVVLTILFLALFIRKMRSIPPTGKLPTNEAGGNKHHVQIFFSAVSVAVTSLSFYILWRSRTGEPIYDVWYTIPATLFLSLVFASAFVLVCLVVLRGKSSWYLVLILFQSFLIESIYYLVWYPSLYGDPLVHLGILGWVNRTGEIYARSYLLSQGYYLDIIKGKGYPSLVVSLGRFLSLDLYWVHNIAIPLIWAIVIPLSLYEITCLVVNKSPKTFPRAAMLAAFSGTFLIPLLIGWGANPTPNTLGFVFLFFSLAPLFRWLLSGGKSIWIVAVMATIAAFMTHPMPGILAFTFLSIVTVLRKVRSAFSRGVLTFGLMAFCPIALGYGGEFTFRNMFLLENVIAFESALLTIQFVIGFVGFFLSLKSEKINRRITFLTFSFYMIVVFNYYIANFGLANVAWGARRILTISDFLLVPFVAFFLDLLVALIPERLHKIHFDLSFSKFGSSIHASFLATLALCLVLSFQSATTLYQAYPHNEVGLAPTTYEIDAIQYLNSTAPRRFVVVSDTLFTNLAIGWLGYDYAYIGAHSGGGFGTGDWHYPLQDLYWNMTHWPSLMWMEKALEVGSAKVAYFVLSERLSNFQEVLEKICEILPVDSIFGGGRLYIFKYPVPPTVGLGPFVTVTYDQAITDKVQSTFSYVSKDNVAYSINLTRHSSYNVTEYPSHWVFGSLDLNGQPSDFDNSSDINAFILKSGLSPDDVLKIRWFANDIYAACGWKEDSFKNGWWAFDVYQIELDNRTDGNILSLSGNFTLGRDSDVYLVKRVGVSTDEFPYVIIRWKSIGPVAVAYTYFGTVGQAPGQLVVSYASESKEWVTTIIKLESGMEITYVTVGINNAGNRQLTGLQVLYVDYILMCNKA